MSEILSPNKYVGRIEPIGLIVIHTMEVPESDVNVAESVGNYFARPTTRASAHVGVDTNSECRYVADKDTAWAAPGANADGLQLELAGRAGQTTGNWADADSKAILERAAQRTASWCRTHDITARHLTNTQLAAGARGIVGHDQVSHVYKRSSHWDPGPNFPWVSFLARVNALLGRPMATAPSRSTARSPIARPGALKVDGDFGPATIRRLQQWAGVTADGKLGPLSWAAIQRRVRVVPDGRPGPNTWKAIQRMVSSPADGVPGLNTYRHLQVYLNSH